MIAPAWRAWCLVIAWMALIFWFSGTSFSAASTAPMFGPLLMRLFPGITPEQIDAAHFAIRKFGHWAEYFILAVLIFRALVAGAKSASLVRNALYSLLGATLFALSDEWHQAFVPGREASLVDVMIDSFGALCGTLLFALVKTQKKPLSKDTLAIARSKKLDNAKVNPQG